MQELVKQFSGQVETFFYLMMVINGIYILFLQARLHVMRVVSIALGKKLFWCRPIPGLLLPC